MCGKEYTDGCLKSVLAFDRLIAPKVIRIVFWIGAVVVFCLGLRVMVKEDFGGGLILMFLGPIAVRVCAELLLVPFKMHDSLAAIKDSLAKPPDDDVPF